MVDNGPNKGESREDTIRREFIDAVRELATHMDLDKTRLFTAQEHFMNSSEIDEIIKSEKPDFPQIIELFIAMTEADPEMYSDYLGRYLFLESVTINGELVSRLNASVEPFNNGREYIVIVFNGDDTTPLAEVDVLSFSCYSDDTDMLLVRLKHDAESFDEFAIKEGNQTKLLKAFEELLTEVRQGRLDGNLQELDVHPNHFLSE